MCKQCDAKNDKAVQEIVNSIEISEYATPQRDYFAEFMVTALLLVGMLVIGCVWSSKAHAYTEEQAVRVIVGEASNQGYKGMVCVGEVLRRQHSLKGFFGFKASHIRHEPKWVWAMARKAWAESKTSNYTKGANHFENLAFGCPYWVKNCVQTFAYKDHVFYKEVA